MRYINPESFNVNMSIMFLAMIVIGGMGSVRGALLGAAFYVLVPEALRGFKDAPGLDLRPLADARGDPPAGRPVSLFRASARRRRPA